MKQVITFIEKKNQEFAELPLFEYMKNKSITPRERLAFAPCMTHFIMSFRDLNSYIYREEPATDEIQEIVNKHSYEEDHHWFWFLEDLEKLGFNPILSFTDASKLMWGSQTIATRKLLYELIGITSNANSLQKLIVIEATEATAHTLFLASTLVTRELQSISQKKYHYFGDTHLAEEIGHSTASDRIQQFIEEIQLTEEARKDAFMLVEQVFKAFTEFYNELFVYAKTHKVAWCEHKRLQRV
jgi:hypothetical protein